MSSADGFDEWYSKLVASDRHESIQRGALGLPEGFDSSSLLPWDGIADVVAQLDIAASSTLADLGCGRGGYGIEIAARTGASLVGVDFSAVAIDVARSKLRPGSDAQFVVGSITKTGLPAASVDAVVSVDAMQFVEPYVDGLRECLRILVPGGRFVLTGWEPIGPPPEFMPARLRRDIGAELCAAGFADVEVRDMARWRAAERALWTTAVRTDPDGDAAIASMREEGERVLAWMDAGRRVMAFGRRP
jgi:SAM-dependent methyltransferase